MTTTSSDRVALVTGASGGIGAAVAERLAREGMAVAVHYSGREHRAKEVAERITGSGGRAVTVGGDVGEPDDVAALFDATTAAFGGVDVVVNAAGVMPLAPLAEMDVETFDRVVRVNLRGTFLVSRTAAPGPPGRRDRELLHVRHAHAAPDLRGLRHDQGRGRGR